MAAKKVKRPENHTKCLPAKLTNSEFKIEHAEGTYDVDVPKAQVYEEDSVIGEYYLRVFESDEDGWVG